MIVYRCASCRTELENPRSMAGKPDVCPACGREHIVPRPRSRTLLVLIGGAIAVGIIAVALVPLLHKAGQPRSQKDSSGQPSSNVPPAATLPPAKKGTSVDGSGLAKSPPVAVEPSKSPDSAKQTDKRQAPGTIPGSARAPATPMSDEEFYDNERWVDDQIKMLRDAQIKRKSKDIEAKVYELFSLLISAQTVPPSSNQFMAQRDQENVKQIRVLFRKFLSDMGNPVMPVADWTVFIQKVEQDSSGQATLTGALLVIKGKDGRAAGCLLGVFGIGNTECLSKVKVMKTPCFAHVDGIYMGREDNEVAEDGAGMYTLKFALNDIRPFPSAVPASKP
jgi:hypothetical protein